MTRPELSFRTAQETDEPIARLNAADGGARMIGLAGAVDLSSRDTGDANLRPFGAPDRTVAVPNSCWRTGEGLSGRDDACSRLSYAVARQDT
jgi:hypothetical protein